MRLRVQLFSNLLPCCSNPKLESNSRKRKASAQGLMVELCAEELCFTISPATSNHISHNFRVTSARNFSFSKDLSKVLVLFQKHLNIYHQIGSFIGPFVKWPRIGFFPHFLALETVDRARKERPEYPCNV